MISYLPARLSSHALMYTAFEERSTNGGLLITEEAVDEADSPILEGAL
jgi:hypothetical protein